MRQILVFLISSFLLSPLPLFGQSAYQLLQSTAKRRFHVVAPSVINRHLKAPIKSASLAKQVARLSHPSSINIFTEEQRVYTSQGTRLVPEIHIITEFHSPVLRSPSTLWGSYRYLRVLTALSRDKKYIHPANVEQWKDVFVVNKYCGVHHIVNKNTLKEIYRAAKAQAALNKQDYGVSLDEMQREAPASLHPFHGNKKYSKIFHNTTRQLELYQQGGVRAILVDYFQSLRALHQNHPNEAPAVPREVINNTLLEGKLWAETFHLRWK